MNDRIEKLSECLYLYGEDAVFFERLLLLEDAYRLYGREGAGRGILYARAFAHVLDHMTVDIRPYEEIVGFMKQSILTDAEEAVFAEKALDDNFKLTPHTNFDTMRLISITDPDDRYCPDWFCSYGHYVPDYARVLKLGYSGIADDARRRLEEGDLTDAQIRFLKAAIITADAMCRYGERYRRCALERIEQTNDEDEIRRLSGILDTLAVSPALPCVTLRQAIQTIWFTNLVENAVVGCRDFGFGRLDQYLHPYYEADAIAGTMDRPRAKELLEELYIHVMENIGFSMENHAPKRILNVNSLQYITLGGTDRQGEPVVNDITFAAIEASMDVQLKQPTLVLRWFPDIDDALLNLAMASCMSGNGYPAFFDERKTIEYLLHRNPGMSREDARDHVFYGCNNIVIPGNSDALHETWHNFPKYLELALNEGRDPFSGVRCGADVPPASQMRSTEELIDALRKQAAHFLLSARQQFLDFDRIWPVMQPFGFESLLSTHCIERAESINEGGSDYKHFTNHLCGLATVADALYAIDRLVFREGRMTLDALNGILRDNWRGHELLRAEILNKFSKYGNNDADVDVFANAVVDFWVEETEKIPPLPNGRIAYASVYTLYHQAPMGRHVGATADGRMAADTLSESLSGTYGTAENGPTAVLASNAKLPQDRFLPSGNNLKLQKAVMAGQEGLLRLRALIETYFEEGGNQLQINILDDALLRAAVREPEKHKNLLVRVVGFSANFVSLSPEQQQNIIERDALS
ncbi:MAG: hypothetical protein LBT52_01460 [Clostridiales Family XIII bacterium]|jgi:formate C-acetyltransferase|nr:hypothetical protein [Clostridiales Family XIII bacterium]